KLTYNSNSKTATSIGADQEPTVHDMQNLVNRLKKEGIYTIARIVVFKDPLLAEQKSDFAIKKKDGRIWQDDQNVKWIDPNKRERSEEHTSELQSRFDLVCRLLL